MTTNEAKRAWYLRCTGDEVAERAVLVGDRGRVLLAAEMLEDARVLNEDRGLTTATGLWKGTPVTVSAFGMGAAIATVVLHELISIGVRSVVRLGTALTLGPTRLGDLVVADGAIRGESTSGTYVAAGYPAAPDLDLTLALRAQSRATGRGVQQGLIASYDGFYSQLFTDDTTPTGAGPAADLDQLASVGVVGLDMESSAVLAVARALHVRAGVVCLASVDGRSHDKLSHDARTAAETDLLTAGFTALSELPEPWNEETR